MVPQRIYLDTNQLFGWFENHLDKKRPESGIVKFLMEKCEDIEKFTSIYAAAEILVNLKERFQGRNLSAEKIGYMFEILREIIGLQMIVESKLTEEVLKFADLCNDHNDAIHIQIAKNQNLMLITKDTDVGRVKAAYANVMSIGKFTRQFD